MKKTIDYYNELPDGYRQLAIKNCPPDILDSSCSSIQSAMHSFLWGKSPEGYEFWNIIDIKACGHHLPWPELPASHIDSHTEDGDAISTLIDRVLQWGRDKRITGDDGCGTLLGQLSKTQEELTETRDAVIEWNLTDDDQIGHDLILRDIKDGIGDCVVTLILAAEMAGLTLEDCLRHAYGEIKGRTGKMINGVFVKDQ
jgi:hypothetical protein